MLTDARDTKEMVLPEAHIGPTSGWRAFSIAELWRYRELLMAFTSRNIKIRYKQTIFGASWAIMQPLIQMIVFTIIFGRIAKVDSYDLPYPIFVYVALVPWTFFSQGISTASNSLVGGGGMMKQVYFERLCIPISSILSCLVDFCLAFLILIALMIYYGIAPTVNIVFLPFFVLLAVATALGVSLLLSSLNVQFRDVKHIVPFLVQTWMFASPVVYPITLIENDFLRYVYALNPMVGVIEGFRWSILGLDTAPGIAILVSIVVAMALLVFGSFYFKRMERTFADVV